MVTYDPDGGYETPTMVRQPSGAAEAVRLTRIPAEAVPDRDAGEQVVGTVTRLRQAARGRARPGPTSAPETQPQMEASEQCIMGPALIYAGGLARKQAARGAHASEISGSPGSASSRPSRRAGVRRGRVLSGPWRTLPGPPGLKMTCSRACARRSYRGGSSAVRCEWPGAVPGNGNGWIPKPLRIYCSPASFWYSWVNPGFD